jgi:hypothetical protein
MLNQIDRAAAMLFPQEGGRTLNIKFLCGGVVNADAQMVAEQVVRAEVQIRAGSARLVADVDSHLTPVA